MRHTLLTTMLACALGLLLRPTPAEAQGAQPSEATLQRALELFTQGQKQFEEGEYAAALEALREAHGLSGSPNAHLYVARCLREMGKLGEAYEEMYATMRDATTRAEADAKYVPTRDSAASELALLDQRVGKLVLTASEGSSFRRLRLGDREIPLERLGSAVAVDPGTTVVTATPTEGEPITVEATVAAGDTKTVSLSATARPLDAPTGGGVRVAGVVLLAVGGGGLLVSAVLAGVASSKHGTLEEECGSSRCPDDPKYTDLIDEGKALQTGSFIALGVGAGVVALSAFLIGFGGPTEPTVAVGPEGAIFGLRQRF